MKISPLVNGLLENGEVDAVWKVRGDAPGLLVQEVNGLIYPGLFHDLLKIPVGFVDNGAVLRRDRNPAEQGQFCQELHICLKCVECDLALLGYERSLYL
jgi:hypothetical protein